MALVGLQPHGGKRKRTSSGSSSGSAGAGAMSSILIGGNTAVLLSARSGKRSRRDDPRGASPEPRAAQTKLHRSAVTTGPGGPLMIGHRMATPPRKSNPKFLPFADALVYAQSLQVYSQREWKAWCKTGARPPNMPPPCRNLAQQPYRVR